MNWVCQGTDRIQLKTDEGLGAALGLLAMQKINQIPSLMDSNLKSGQNYKGGGA